MKKAKGRIAKKMKQNGGITLIVLVTIIVALIILATISIFAIFGENGFIKNKEQIKNTQENVTVVEEKLDENTYNIENHSNVNSKNESSEISAPTETVKRLLVSTVTTTNHKTIIAQDAKGNQVVVPGGFKIASDSGETVQQGIVIEDNNRKSICMDTSKQYKS